MSSSSFLVGAFGAGVASLPPINVEDRLTVLAVHVGTTARRLANTKRRGQATVAKAEASRGQTTINQKVAEKMFKIILGLSNILNIIKENSGIHRGSGCGGRSMGQQFATTATVTIASEANSGNGGGRLTVPVPEAAQGQTTINQKSSSNNSGHGGGGGDGCSRGSGSGNGDGGNVGGNVGGNAATMTKAAVTAAPTVAEGVADVGGGYLYYYLHNSNSMYRCDNNCQLSCVWQNTMVKCFVAKR